LRFIAAHRPASLLLENVPNLVKIDDGAALERILSEVRFSERKKRPAVFRSLPQAPCDKHDRFTKTGSGQTREKFRKKRCVFPTAAGQEERLTYFKNFGSYPAGTGTRLFPPFKI
jgi:hypothetical protein